MRARSSGVASWPSMKITGSPTKRNSEKAIRPDGQHDEHRLAQPPEDERRHGLRESVPDAICRETDRAGSAAMAATTCRGRARRDPYRIWLSEVMLQQTQVSTVIPYYQRFLEKYPDGRSALAARERRGSARAVERPRLLRARPQPAQGGRSKCRGTAFRARQRRLPSCPAWAVPRRRRSPRLRIGERAAILDGNVKRVLARCFLSPDKDELWQQAEALLPRRGIERYTQALMDLGATTCTRANPRLRRVPGAGICCERARPAGSPSSRRRASGARCHSARRRGSCCAKRRGARRAAALARHLGRAVVLSGARAASGRAAPRRLSRSSTASRISGCASGRCCWTRARDFGTVAGARRSGAGGAARAGQDASRAVARRRPLSRSRRARASSSSSSSCFAAAAAAGARPAAR